MNDPFPPGEPVSQPSEPTMRGVGMGRPGEPVLGRIDHYDVLRRLGGGGFGVVYLARDTASGVEVAIKTLHPLLKHNAEEMDRLRGRFALVSRLTHQNIAKALVLHPVRDVVVFDEAARADLKLSPGDPVMVMDYAPGVTLSKWRRRFPDGVVPPELALEIGRQLAAALDYAHAEKIVHRDVKPSNVMVETLGGASSPSEPQSPDSAVRSEGSPHRIRVRILDFGLAAEIRSSMARVSTEAGDTSGTRPYMAPEQWVGRWKQDGRADQYALACVLYELLSGAPPFAGVFETGDPAVMKDAVLHDAPEPVEGLFRGANAALLRALAKDPAQRFPSCAAFVEALGRDASTKRPRRLALAATLGALATLGVLWFALGRGGDTGNIGNIGSIGSVGGISDIPGISDINAPSPDSGVESAEFDPHAESAESAEPSGRDEPTARPQRPDPHAESAEVLPPEPPDGAPLEDLQSARDRIAAALSARRAAGWPDTAPGSASLVSRIAALDTRIDEALAAEEEADRRAEEERLAAAAAEKNAAARAAVQEARDLRELGRLKNAAATNERDVSAFRKWDDGEFKSQFEALDRNKRALDGLSRASDLAKAREAALEIQSAALWIAENAPAREEIDSLEKAIDALAPELAAAEASRYARKDLNRAATTRKDAESLRDAGEFARAKARLESAKAQYDAALASARTARAAAKAKEVLLDADAAKIRKDWAKVIAAADKALGWEPGNKRAAALKDEAERALAEKEAKRRAKEEAERQAKEAAERQAKEEAERRAKEEAERRAKEEAERRVREEAERLAKEEAERRAKAAALRVSGPAAERKPPVGQTLLHVAATLDGRPARNAKLKVGGFVHDLPKEFDLTGIYAFGPGQVWIEGYDDGQTKAFDQVYTNWKGLKTITVAFGEAEPPPEDESGEAEAGSELDDFLSDAEWEALSAGSRRAGALKTVRAGGQALRLRWCPATTSEAWKRISGGKGYFTMGSPASEEGRFSNESRHRVTLTKGFWLGETEVTQGLWKKVMGDNPSHFKSGDEYPVEEVSWNDCQAFLKKLNAQAPVAGFTWALPTEAQWEYACRAGTAGAYSGNGRPDDMGWHSGNSNSSTHPVGKKEANAWGFRDMHGNVWEWCADRYEERPPIEATDPMGPASGPDRVNRGGSLYNDARFCRSARRGGNDPDSSGHNLGLRVALVPVR